MSKIPAIFGYVAIPEGGSPGLTTLIHTEEAHAIAHAQQKARELDVPFYVYKVIATHYIKAPVMVVEEVK